MWKIQTVQIRKEIYYSLVSSELSPDEQKGNKGKRWSAVHVSACLQEEPKETEKCSFGVDWQRYDSKKMENRFLKVFKIADQFSNFITENMKN